MRWLRFGSKLFHSDFDNNICLLNWRDARTKGLSARAWDKSGLTLSSKKVNELRSKLAIDNNF